MIRMLFTIARRDLALAFRGGRQGGVVLPVLFFLAVAMLFPFAVGPDPRPESQRLAQWQRRIQPQPLVDQPHRAHALHRAGEGGGKAGENADQAGFADAVGARNLTRLARPQRQRQPGKQQPLAPPARHTAGGQSGVCGEGAGRGNGRGRGGLHGAAA